MEATESVRMARHRVRRDRERGAVLVETALLLPLILLLVFGVIEFSFAFQSSAVLQDATRRSARTAASHAGDTGMGDLVADVATDESRRLPNTALPVYLMIYSSNELGYPGDPENDSITVADALDCGSPDPPFDCLLYEWDEATRSFDASGGKWDPSSQDACQQPYDRVGVAMLMAYNPLTSIFDPFLKREVDPDGKELATGGPRIDHVAFVFEPEPLGAC